MEIFVTETKLLYEYINTAEFKRVITYNYEICEFKEKMYDTNIEIHPDFIIKIKNLICENQDEALLISNFILEPLCKSISIILQIQNYDNRQFQPNVSFNNYNITIASRTPLDSQVIVSENKNGDRKLFLKDNIHIRDGINAMNINQDLDLKNLEILFNSFNESNPKKFYIDTIFRALRSRDVESKYFTLFTIIERLETTFSQDEDVSKLLFNEQQQEELLCNIKPKISIILDDKGSIERIYNRISQIIKSSTVMTRHEKLCLILNQNFKITKVDKGMMKYDIDCKKIKNFIDKRNSLFHGKSIEGKEYDEMVKLTNQLLELCLLILYS